MIVERARGLVSRKKTLAAGLSISNFSTERKGAASGDRGTRPSATMNLNAPGSVRFLPGGAPSGRCYGSELRFICDTRVCGPGGFATRPLATVHGSVLNPHVSATSVRTFAAKSSSSRQGQVVYKCSSCGETAMQWSGQCMSCKEWSTLEKVTVSAGGSEGGGGGARAAARFSSSSTSSAMTKFSGLSRASGSSSGKLVRGAGDGLGGVGGRRSGSWVVDSDGEGPRTVREISIGTGSGLSDYRIKLNGVNGAEFSRVLGGGIVPGSLVLVGGEPGVGKSTLLLQVADMLSFARGGAIRASRAAGLRGTGDTRETETGEMDRVPDNGSASGPVSEPILYVSGEESVEQIGSRAARMNMDGNDNLYLYSSTRLDVILDAVLRLNPAALIVDSIQTVYLDDLPSSAGSVVQVRECASALLQVAKRTGIPVFLVGHVTKSGDIAGPRVLEHIVDVVLYMEGGRQQQMRLVRCVKNRYGPTDEVGVFSMEEEGMCAVSNPSAFFLSSQSDHPSVCSAVTVVMEGTRPLMMEVQALCSRSHAGSNAPPMRVPSGVKKERLWLILAVLSKYTRIKPFGVDIHVNVTGGLNVTEPCADLSIACAIASSYYERPLPTDTAVVGEIGLGGELRPVVQLERRVLEAQKLGFRRIIVPRSSGKLRSKVDIDVVRCDTVEAAFDVVIGKARRRGKNLEVSDDVVDDSDRLGNNTLFGEETDHYV